MKLKTALMGAAAVLAFAPAAFAERGADGELKIIQSQAASTMNQYLSSGTKDINASSMVSEPLASYKPDGTLMARLAAEIPTLENGGVSADGKTITWKLLPGVKWSDGTDFTADDVVFTGQYCMDPAGGCAQLSKFEGIEKIEAVDPLTVKITFLKPKTNPYSAFVGALAPILQKAQFEKCLGANASSCTEANFKPIGTGPFMVTDFKTNDVAVFEANPHYRDPAKPAFARATLKGGNDAMSTARAVMETAEYDYGWNTQIEPEVQAQMIAAGKGKFVTAYGGLVERLELNMTDPSSALPEGERSTVKHPHPIFSDIRVRQALSMAIDRSLLVEIGYGEAARPTCNLVPAPEMFASDNTGCLTQDVEGAKKLLDEAGWTDTDGDGIRDKDGKKLSLVFQTSVNPIRQNFQAMIKQWWNDVGIEVELKQIDPSVFFGGDAGSPDTFQKFYADVQMFANEWDGTDPQAYLAQLTCEKAPKPEDQWQGENIPRFCNPDYDALIKEMLTTADAGARAEQIKTLNDMVTKD
ncbi:peptide ABC transporter substrate-binding protein, partial [Rhodobacter capsulatus]